MTNPTPDQGWNPQDLPVLTDVVEVEAIPVLDIPAYDFSAELDALAQVLPGEAPPGLTLPDELSLDDVLGDDLGDAEQASLNASQLIERLPSLDLEVDLPSELSLDDVLPGLDHRHDNPLAASPLAGSGQPADDFVFELDDVPQASAPEAAGSSDGLGALFARATFEPVVPSTSVVPPDAPADAGLDALQPDQASLDQFAAQLDDFDEPADLPELPLDAFLNKADDAISPQTEIFAAASTDDEWASTWEPPATQAADLAELNAVPVLMPEPDTAPVLQSSPPLLTDAGWEVTGTDAPLASDAANLRPEAAMPDLSVAPAFEALPWDVPDEPAANLAMSIDDILADLQPVQAPLAVAQDKVLPLAPPTPVTLAEPAEDPLVPVAEPVVQPAFDAALAGTAAQDEIVVEADFVVQPAAPEPMADAVERVTSPPVEETAFADMPAASGLSAVAEPVSRFDQINSELGRAVEPVPAWLQAAQAELAAREPVLPEPAAHDIVQSISLDSLPMGVLGGGLGLAGAVVSPAATLGEPAGKLPGGDWPLSVAGFHAGDKEVELAWARDLGAEPPLDLDQLPDASEPEVAPVIAEVIRLRRQPLVPDELAAPAVVASPAQVTAQPVPVLSENDIHIEAVGQAMPAEANQPPGASAVAAGLDENALIEALYARVLPRMKVELALWMQDALEQQAKQLMAGVMKQLKEDFDMMLAESLRASLREALDEAASHNKEV
ncbi:hypothetical protein PQU95_10410 [Vogesella sp. DC21W]|uniref:Uncharacterized protein n=1 Tax=Vogesella aquatica TaxID=2984206 RepID=A0ABT5IYH3_9NEIS|nr:hypothetical protein [Vogesella aquatica]MDC7717623.1 hypothetical protein [Vogesella aquatica]